MSTTLLDELAEILADALVADLEGFPVLAETTTKSPSGSDSNEQADELVAR